MTQEIESRLDMDLMQEIKDEEERHKDNLRRVVHELMDE